MSRYFTIRSFILLMLLFSNAAVAQNFGRNSVWYRSQPSGMFKCYYTGDTVILGKKCSSIFQQALTFTPQPLAVLADAGPLYLYDTEDTVFVYNHFFKKFTPLYVFNVAVGDTVHLPVLPLSHIQWLGNVTDSTFDFVVDSIKDVLYDTAWLQTVFTHSICYYGTNKRCYSWGYGAFPGAYARRIGGVSFGLLPGCRDCYTLLVDGYYLPGPMLCYSDSTTSIKLTSGECSRGAYPLLVDAPEAENGLEIYPNPVSDRIRYRNKTGKRILSVNVYDASGREMHTPDLSVDELATGVYFVRFQFDNHFSTQKITVFH